MSAQESAPPRPSRSKFSFPIARERLALFGHRNFRVFFAGYVTSMLGSAMSEIALTFAVLGTGAGPAGLGIVFAANVVPLVIFMLGGGVLADRFSRRSVMLAADASRLCVQAALTVALLAGRPPVWLFALLGALLGTGEAIFTPALGGLRPEIAPPDRLVDANALLSVAQSAARITGPALAGVLIALTSPAVVIGLDAATFGVSVLALARLRAPAARPSPHTPWRDLADGWAQFRSQPWLRATTVQFALFNLVSWAPYLLLGPLLARQYLGGARAWGIVSAAYAAAAIAAGLGLAGRKPARPLIAAVLGSFGFAAPCLALALRAPLPAVVAGAALAGAGSATFDTFWYTVMQQRVPPEMLGRATAFSLTGSYALGACGYAVIGPLAAVAGARTLLAVGAGYAALSSAAMMIVPSVRSVTWAGGGEHAEGAGTGAEGRAA